MCRSPVAVARSSGGVVLRYVLPVLWMTSRRLCCANKKLADKAFCVAGLSACNSLPSMFYQSSFLAAHNKRLSCLHILGPLTPKTDFVNNLKHICSRCSTVTCVLIDCMPISFRFTVFVSTIITVYFSTIHYVRRH